MPDNDTKDETRSPEDARPPAQEAAAVPENRRARRAAAATSKKQGGRRRPPPRPPQHDGLGIGAGEMVDDALSRAADGSARWVKDHFNIVQWLVVLAIGGWIGWEIYSWRADKIAVKVSDDLSAAVAAQMGRLGSPDDEGKVDANGIIEARRIFATNADRLQAAGDAYRQVSTEYPRTVAGDLARMGLAGVLYDQGKFDDAKKLFDEVANGALAKKNPEARGRSLEGSGLCLEQKGDRDGALKKYGELENAEIPGFGELALYDQARLLHEKGDDAGAKERLKKVVERLGKESNGPEGLQGQPSYLAEAARTLLLRIDPSAVPSESSEDALRRALEEFQKKLPPGVKSMPATPAAP